MAYVGASDQARLARTMSIIHASSPAHPGVLKILFYGQSITSANWTDRSLAHLRRTYPNTVFVARNMALGGNDAALLERAADRDITEFYPDLVVFHVYGDQHAYERIIQIIRSRTAAEVIVQTDHVRFPIEPVCSTKFRLSVALPPGCSGRLLLHQHVWDDFMSTTFIPKVAGIYGLAVDPRRREWNAYLNAHRLAPAELLKDGLHPNDRGWRLAAVLFDRYFDDAYARWKGERQDLVKQVRPLDSRASGFEVVGNRIEIVSDAPIATALTATVDGKRPRQLDGCWQISRTTTIPATLSWPAIRQVAVDPAYHVADEWTATLSNLRQGQKSFRYTLASDRAGLDGDGSSKRDFTSPSGRVRIAAEDWAIGSAAALTHQYVPEGFKVRWRQNFVCTDQPRVALPNGAFEYRNIIATGLRNGSHRVRLSVAPGAAAHVRELRVYSPPLWRIDD